jgi:D-alanine-D-alanine ligase
VTRIAVLVGGRSSEHEISCISARSIVDALDGHDISIVGITRDGAWVGGTKDLDSLLVREGSLPHVDDAAPSVDISAALQVDVVFPVLHGPWGEDGTVQGLLEMYSVPYVGSGVLSSAISMDKGHMKAALRSAGLPVGDWVMIPDRDWRERSDIALARVADLGLPVFVKPARAGSSRGITKVHRAADLRAAIEDARTHDPRVIVEAAISHMREIECAVLVGPDGTPQASRCAEIVVGAEHEFYDFAAKYVDDSATLVVPADLDPALEARVQELALAAFEALDCAGLARVDVFVRGSEVLINELNTMPGFTSISMFPRMWAASGLDYRTLVSRLVDDALRRGTGLA